MIHGKNYFTEGILKVISNAAKSFDISATGLSVLHNYFDVMRFQQN